MLLLYHILSNKILSSHLNREMFSHSLPIFKLVISKLTVVRPFVHPSIRYYSRLISFFISDRRQSNLVIKSCRQLKDLLVIGQVYRHARKQEDAYKLKAGFYGAVDIIYDSEDRYVPKCYVCKKCTQLIVVIQEGGHSALHQHKCVIAYVKGLKKLQDEGQDKEDEPNVQVEDTDTYHYNQFMITNAQIEMISRAMSNMSEMSYNRGMLGRDTIKNIMPRTWYYSF